MAYALPFHQASNPRAFYSYSQQSHQSTLQPCPQGPHYSGVNTASFVATGPGVRVAGYDQLHSSVPPGQESTNILENQMADECPPHAFMQVFQEPQYIVDWQGSLPSFAGQGAWQSYYPAVDANRSTTEHVVLDCSVTSHRLEEYYDLQGVSESLLLLGQLDAGQWQQNACLPNYLPSGVLQQESSLEFDVAGGMVLAQQLLRLSKGDSFQPEHAGGAVATDPESSASPDAACVCLLQSMCPNCGCPRTQHEPSTGRTAKTTDANALETQEFDDALEVHGEWNESHGSRLPFDVMAMINGHIDY